jgi:outer membrane immunogenic protein
VPVVATTWSGLYIGAHCGAAWGQTTTNTVDGGDNFDNRLNPEGGICGGQIGYNWQTGTLVFGIEGDAGALLLKHNDVQPSDDDNHVLRSVKYNGYGTITGRLGFSSGSWLAYVKGGAAFAGIKHSGYELPDSSSNAYSVSTTKTGWTIGGGFEYAMTANWSWRVEYLYMDFGHSNNTTTDTSIDIRHTDRVQAVTLGVNYRFGGPGTARY